MSGETILLAVGVVAVVVIVGAVYIAVRLGHQIAPDGTEVPRDPFAVVFGVFNGKVSWPTASWWVFGGILALLAFLGSLMGVRSRRMRSTGHGSTPPRRTWAAAATSKT